MATEFFKAKHTRGFDLMMDLKDAVGLMDSRRYRDSSHLLLG